jgi:hypothetical protein
MRGPPDPEMRNRPAENGTANRRADNWKPDESNETVRALQAASLRRRFALGYCIAAALAPLVWGLPR